MKKTLIGILIAFLSISQVIEAQTTQPKRKITFTAPTDRKRIPQRISSSMSRGCNRKMPQVILLTPPDFVGQTVSKQAEVFVYFNEKPTNIPIFLTISKYDESNAIAEKQIKVEVAGVQKIQLPVELKVGQLYQWSITLVCQTHPKRIDENEEISGLIERIALPDNLSQEIERSSLWDQVQFYASLGIWHDSLRLTQKSSQFNDFLEQVGIDSIK